MTDDSLPFASLAPGVGIGVPAPPMWLPIAECPLLVLVGVTGVGKSTTLAALNRLGLAYHLLPDRRTLTDRLIIAAMQIRAGQPPAPVPDRILRFDYTRQYRTLYPGGMAHALAQLRIDPALLPELLLFDGLRGENEVTHAAQLLPLARFAVLEAPDAVRVARLMGRGDPFDQLHAAALPAGGDTGVHSFADLGVPEARALVTPAEEQALLAMVHQGQVTAAELRSSVGIVWEERRSYDPAAASAALRRLAEERTLVVDTARHPPEVVAARIAQLMMG